MGKGLEQICHQKQHISDQQVSEKMLEIADYQGDTNQNYNISPHIYQMVILKKEKKHKL